MSTALIIWYCTRVRPPNAGLALFASSGEHSWRVGGQYGGVLNVITYEEHDGGADAVIHGANGSQHVLVELVVVAGA